MSDFLKAGLNRDEVAACLDFIVEGKPYVWSDFTDVPIVDEALDAVRLKVAELEHRYPCKDGSAYLNPQGLEILKSIARELRSGSV